MLKVNNICTYYGNIQALKGVSLAVEEGEIVTLIGANGAGKTTTLMSLCGIVPPRSGEIEFQGQQVQGLSGDKVVRMGLIQVPEGRRIFPNMTVAENLEMGAYLRTNKLLIKQDTDMVMELFPILAQRRNQLGGTLSGGEQQMLAISRALMARPRLLLLDEPSLGLAPIIIQQIFDIIRRINHDNNTTIFLVEQNAMQALKLAHRGYVMENGRITLADSAENLLNNEAVKKAYLGI
ncbi:MAG TPA: ABC transporter ATP-binding protein [Geothermobacteraceae bacterium]|nr:ABC transporter ATP-binding protein [Geothermobacteraceae bacterium]